MGQDANNSVLLFVTTPNSEGEFTAAPGIWVRLRRLALLRESPGRTRAQQLRRRDNRGRWRKGSSEKKAEDFASVLEGHLRRDEVLLLLPAGEDLMLQRQ